MLHRLKTEIINHFLKASLTHIIPIYCFLFFCPFFFHVCFIYEGGPYGTKFGSPEGGFPPPYADGYGVHLVCAFLNLQVLDFAFNFPRFHLLCVLLFRELQRKVLCMGQVLLQGKYTRSLA